MRPKVLVVDNGLYVEFARTLARSGRFSQVGYFAPFAADFPAARDLAVGAGFPEIKREYELFEVLEEYELFAFPDLYWADMQAWAHKNSGGVWGSGRDEYLEVDREALLRFLKSHKLRLPHYNIYKGLDKVAEWADDGDIVKVNSAFRGDTETFRVNLTNLAWQHEIALRLGPLADLTEFIVESPIRDAHEPGFDAIVANGAFLWPMLLGYEEKDKGYIGRVVEELPEVLDDIRKAIESTLSVTYSNFLSTEVRGKILIDITTRVPQPPGDAEFAVISNLGEIVRAAATGAKVPEPDYSHAFVCQLIIIADDPKRFHGLSVPHELMPFVFMNRAFQVGDVLWTAPQKAESLLEVGAVVGMGNSEDEAFSEAQRIAKELALPDDLHISDTTVDALKKKLDTAAAKGFWA